MNKKVTKATPSGVKRLLKPQPTDKAFRAVKNIQKRGEKVVFVYGWDDFTEEFLKEAMKKATFMIRYSDVNNNKAAQMQATLKPFSGSLDRCDYVNRNAVFECAWGDVLVIGSKVSFENNQDPILLVKDNYKEVITLEEY